MKIIIRIFITILLLLIGCSPLKDNKAIRQKISRKATGPILIGAVSSWEKEKEDHTWSAVEMAVKEINDQGGIKGRKIEVIKMDDDGSENKGLEIAQIFCENTEILAVIGHGASHISILSSVLYEFNGLPRFTPTSEGSGVHGNGFFRFVIYPFPDYSHYVEHSISYLLNSQNNRVLLFNRDDLFWNKYADYFEKQGSRNGLNIVARIPFSETASDIFFRNKLLAANYYYKFDAILVAGEAEDAIPFLKYIKMYDMKYPLVGTELFDSMKLVHGIKEIKKSVIFPSVFNTLGGTNTRANDFIKKFESTYGVKPSSRTASWYDIVFFLSQTMLSADEMTPVGLLEAVKKVSSWQGVIGKIKYEYQDQLKVSGNEIKVYKMNEDGSIAEGKGIENEPIK